MYNMIFILLSGTPRVQVDLIDQIIQEKPGNSGSQIKNILPKLICTIIAFVSKVKIQNI